MDFRALALGLVGVVLVAAAVSAPAAERTPTLAFSFDGSLPLSFSDNTYRNPTGRSNYLTSPYLRASAHGRLVPDLSYSFYASGGFEKYPSRQADDNTFATLGASLTRRWGNFGAGASYERNHAYDGIFGPFLYVANDVGVYSYYNYTDVTKTFRLRPGASLSRRFSDDPSATSVVYSFKLDVERKLSERWWFTITPRIRRQHFFGGENTGRVDTVYSLGSGLRYSITDQIGLSGGFGYDRRESTTESRSFDSFSFGISLDFSHTFGSLRK